jgi:hypothetical protein
MQMIFPTSTTATIGHTAGRMQRGHILSARSPSLPGRLQRRRGNFEQAEAKADCSRSRPGAQNPLAERCRSVQTALLPLATSETDA